MQRVTRLPLLALGVLIVASACRESPTVVPIEEVTVPGAGSAQVALSSGDIVALGGRLFEDVNLSVHRNQSCQTCHEPSQGFAAPLAGVMTRGSVVEGSVAGKFGNRKPPSAAYATLAPRFSGGNNPTGGVFWDGRATGTILGNPAADQALGPFINPVEQALPDKACLILRVREQADKYESVYPAAWWSEITAIVFPANAETVCSTPVDAAGEFVDLTSGDRARVNTAYDNAALAIKAFEDTFNRFSSRFDRRELTAQESQGQQLFGGKGKCTQCHPNKGTQPLFTDFAFHNLGVPRNPAHPAGPVDRGLGGFTGQSRHDAKFRTPTVRNVGMGVDRTFMHNGALVSLEQVVDFYNTRDALPTCTDPAVIKEPKKWGSTMFGGAGCWPAAESRLNLDTKQMGKLGLTKAEVEAIVAYMRAMTDL